jgi:hypothetical protein
MQYGQSGLQVVNTATFNLLLRTGHAWFYLFMFYVMMFCVINVACSQMIGWLLNNKLESMWKVVFIP